MNNKDKKEHPIHIGRTIIWQFFLVMILIYLINMLFDYLAQKYVSPFLTDVLEVDEIIVISTGVFSRFKVFLALLLQLLPMRVPMILRSIIIQPLLGALNVTIEAPEAVEAYGSVAVSAYYLLLLSCMLLMLVISLLPYIAGGLWFVHEIRKKVDILREYDRQRTEEYEKKRNLLLSDIAHDIKTPITAITGYAKALNDGLVKQEDQAEYLNTIYHKSMRVSELINMMFEYIKLDSTGYTLNRSVGDLAEMTREVVADMYQDCEEAGLELDVDIPEEACSYNMDKLQLSRVVTNLLSNAVKYLEKGDRVKVILKRTSADPEAQTGYEIRVEDSGVQIEDELADVIFTPFTRGDKTRSTKGGTGLGLSIAHKIVELHGGELTLDRQLNDGYTKAFVIRV